MADVYSHLLKFFFSWCDNPELKGLPRKFLQHFLHFSQSQQEMCAIFSVLNFEYPAGNLVWYSDVHFKQWAVTEFLVVEKQSIIRIHKRLKNIYGVNAVHKETASLLRFIKCRF